MSDINIVQEHNDLVKINVSGRFDYSKIQIFQALYTSKDPVKEYHVNLSQSEFLDSSALGILLALRDYAASVRGKVVLINCQEDVRKILEITRMNELFDLRNIS